MPRIASLIEDVGELLDWSQGLVEEAQKDLRQQGLPQSRHACQVFLSHCNEAIAAAARLCGAEVDLLFRTYDLRATPADNLPSTHWRSYLSHAAVTLTQLVSYLEGKARSNPQAADGKPAPELVHSR
jgi:hypothetical protein